MECSFGVAEYKIKNNMPVFQADREKEIIQRIKSCVPQELENSGEVFFTTFDAISQSVSSIRSSLQIVIKLNFNRLI